MKKAKDFGKKEVEYKQKAGTAWSHSYLNQKPWHPLSYPNQRRKWIAEQTHAQRESQAQDVAREFAQEQEFFRQTAQMTKKEKEKMEAMQAVSFMYMRPPGYNAEAARAAEIADERKKAGLLVSSNSKTPASTIISGMENADEAGCGQWPHAEGSKKSRVKDVFGRNLPTAEEFPALKDAPRHDTGAPVRVKPFAIEIRNVKCARCGAFGHQSGDRECPLRNVLMPSEEARLKRDDPLNVILAQSISDEPLKWELKQPPGGLSPARGGFKPDDPNQQIIPDEDIYDEYGGFLVEGGVDEALSIPNMLASLSHEQRKELTDVNGNRKHKRTRKKKHGSDTSSNEHGRWTRTSSVDKHASVAKHKRKQGWTPTSSANKHASAEKHKSKQRLDKKLKKRKKRKDKRYSSATSSSSSATTSSST